MTAETLTTAADFLTNVAFLYLVVRFFNALLTPGSLIAEFFADVAGSRPRHRQLTVDDGFDADGRVKPAKLPASARVVRILADDAELAADAIIELAIVRLRGVHSEPDDVQVDDLVLELDDVRLGKDMIHAPVVRLGEGRSTADRIVIGDLIEACEALRDMARQC
jgi:hypothetical protein